MSMPLQAVDRLFSRLTMTYGPSFTRTFDGLDLNEVKSLWSHELSFYNTHEKMSDIAWALENLPERAPNVIEFKNLCRKAPKREAPKLPEPKANPERLKAELAKLMAPAKEAAAKAQFTDGREWARRIVEKQQAGEKLNAVTLRFAKEALS
jgi:hypothetical protein